MPLPYGDDPSHQEKRRSEGSERFAGGNRPESRNLLDLYIHSHTYRFACFFHTHIGLFVSFTHISVCLFLSHTYRFVCFFHTHWLVCFFHTHIGLFVSFTHISVCLFLSHILVCLFLSHKQRINPGRLIEDLSFVLLLALLFRVSSLGGFVRDDRGSL